MTDAKPLSARRAALLDVLNRELPPGEKMHGWRCEHPDRYPEPCNCADIMADIIEEALDVARSEPGADFAGLLRHTEDRSLAPHNDRYYERWAERLRAAGVTVSPDLAAAAQAVVDKAEPDDDFDGQFIEQEQPL